MMFFCAVALTATTAYGQLDQWPSPEVEQIYKQAHDYLTMGNLKDAIVTYKQTILLAPDKMVLYRDLGKAYYLSGDYANAEKTLQPLLQSSEVDAQSYQIMSTCLREEKHIKESKSTLQHGLNKFPTSGLLFHDMGLLYADEDDKEAALKAWLDGIKNDPAYHMNYYEAAKAYMGTDNVTWGLLYGEIFLNIEHETPRANEMRKMLLDGYKVMFDNIATNDIPQFGKTKKPDMINSFTDAMHGVYTKLTPVISDGITTENLTMVRTRFLMDWFSAYGDKYPFSLFAYQDQLLRNGFFDIYNEWLFAKAESPQEYTAWTKFHQNAIPQFQAWQSRHALQPVAADFYNDKKVDGLFSKKRK